MTHPTDDPLREALELLPCPFCGGEAGVIHIENGPNEGGSCVSCSVCLASSNVEFGRKENFRDNWNRRAALAAAPQPAPAPAADERAEMIEVIVQADDAYDRVQGGTWAGAIADAMLAAGYRKADALLAERDALIHDIERAKASESALLAELEQARGIVRQGSRVNSDWFQRRDHMAPSRHSKKPGSCTFGPSTS